MAALIHPTAVVDPGAELGEEVRIGPFAVIEADTRIGEGCSIAAHALVKRYVRMGPGNRVAEHAVIGGEPQDYAFRPCESWVEIGAENLIREGVTIHRSSRPGGVTRIGNRNFLMAGAHVAHDCALGDGIVLVNGAGLTGHVTVGDRAFVSGYAGVHQFCRVGRLAMIGGLSKVVQDCLPFVITDGNPARARGLNLVGLRRAGFGRESIAALKAAYRTLLRSALPLERALAELEASPEAVVRELAEFVRGSRRGFAHEPGQ